MTNYPNNIFIFISNQNYPYLSQELINQIEWLSSNELSDDQLAGLEFAFVSMNDQRIPRLIKMKFQQQMSYKTIADYIRRELHIKISSERVRQLIYNGCRNLATYSSLRYIFHGYNAICKMKFEDCDVDTIPISVLPLSTRTYNILMRKGIDTISKLIKLCIYKDGTCDLMTIKNIGKRSFEEIMDVMKSTEYINLIKEESEPDIHLTVSVDMETDITESSLLLDVFTSPRTYRALYEHGIRDVGTLIWYMENPRYSFEKIHNFGKQRYIEMARKLISLGLLDEKYLNAVLDDSYKS